MKNILTTPHVLIVMVFCCIILLESNVIMEENVKNPYGIQLLDDLPPKRFPVIHK